jgi:hypothetical protein
VPAQAGKRPEALPETADPQAASDNRAMEIQMNIEDQAKEVHKAVRDFYKGCLKSSNKTYKMNFNYENINTFEKRATRNDNKAKVTKMLSIYRSLLDHEASSLFERGKKISQQPRQMRIGNCEEMALLAAYYGLTTYSDLDGKTWLGSITTPGDHAFCLLGPSTQPGWHSPPNMSKSNESKFWIVDPWANICCPIKDYYDSFMKKMAQWDKDEKMIIFKPCTATASKNVSPAGDEYKWGFMNGVLGFRPVDATGGKVEIQMSDLMSDWI